MDQKHRQSRGLKKPLVGIIMGSSSDSPLMSRAAEMLDELGVPFEYTVVSAHRTPDRMVEYARTAHTRGLKVIIAGAGGAAHLPGMTAALTPLPVIGVPIRSHNSLDGMDSLLSIVQMPEGVPVATVAVNNSANAGILAAQIIAASDSKIQRQIIALKNRLAEKVQRSIQELNGQLPKGAVGYQSRHQKKD